MPLRINVVTIFPEFFAGPLGLSIPEKARAAGGVEYNIVDLRNFTHDKHRTVDDYPYGGGAGMVMKPGPFFEAVESLNASAPIVLLSPRGKLFSHADAVRYAEGQELTLLCGHYKDVDQRVADHLATEEISLGDFVLSGGEAAALAIIDATVRLIPGAMSDLESARTDSFLIVESVRHRTHVRRTIAATKCPMFLSQAITRRLRSGEARKEID